MKDKISSFAEFYPYYLGEHRNGRCRQLHALGSTLAMSIVLVSGYFLAWDSMWLAVFAGYGPAWIGHYYFEKNRPATFSYPLWSFAADWVMYVDMIRGRVPFTGDLNPGIFSEFSVDTVANVDSTASIRSS